jgi:hypothetical protein
MPPALPKPGGPLQAALLDTTTAATTRATEGQALFSPIASFLDQHRSQVSNLAPHLCAALASLSDELSSVAQRHFDAFITGSSPLEAHGLRRASTPSSPPQSYSPPGLSQSTYASVASSLAPSQSTPKRMAKKTGLNQAPLKAPAPDNRLFVRLPDGHQARDMQGYAILTSLRAQLGPDGSLLKEVQATKTGFALCPTSPNDLKALEAKGNLISTFFGGCQVDRGSPWVSYRVTNVPRKVGQILANGTYSLVPVDSQLIIQAVAEATMITPVSATETTYSVSNPHLHCSSWFVNFPEGTTTAIPRQLRIFGITATTRFLPRKTTVVQCNRCWMWHNARSCARPPRCRLCGSTQHLEERHNNFCSSPEPHLCPPRCFHCHGPHPADDANCLLRPTPAKNTFTKLQKSEIRKTYSAELAQARTEAGCTLTPSLSAPHQDQMAIDVRETTEVATYPSLVSSPLVVIPPRPMTPPPPSPLRESPSTNRAVRFADRPTQPANRFSTLLSEQL